MNGIALLLKAVRGKWKNLIRGENDNFIHKIGIKIDLCVGLNEHQITSA